MPHAEQLLDDEIQSRRFQFAIGLSRLMAFGAGGVIPLTMLVIWLFTQESRLLMLAGSLTVMLAGWGPLPYLYRRGRTKLSLYMGLGSLLLAVIIVPVLLPGTLPAASIGVIVLISMSFLLLGSRGALPIFVVSFPIYLFILIIIQTNVDLGLPPLDANLSVFTGIVVSMMALLIGGLTVRMIVVGQEEQFLRAERANDEIRQRVEVEQQQREQLAQVNLNLENRIAVDQQRRDFLENLVNRITDAAQVLNNAAVEIQAATVQQLASATEQDTTIVQTAATVEEVRQMVSKTAERAQVVALASRDSVQVSAQGSQAVSEAVAGMRIIRQRVDAIAHTILALSAHTQQIGEIVEAVDTLADQSRLLALNASIEAARAGEEGRGFAVVAMEVRQLAEQSRQATARIASILSEIQQSTNEAVMVTEQGSKGTDSGVMLVEQAGKAIEKLATVIEEAAHMAAQIAASTSQQTSGMDQLAQAMNHIRQASSQTASSTNQTEQSARQLSSMAQALNEIVADYEVARGA